MNDSQQTPAGRYRILEPIGRGRVGEVFLAEFIPELGEPGFLALAQLDQRIASDADLVLQLHQQVELLSNLVHPGIARTLALQEIDGGLCLLMEYAPGVDADFHAQLGALPTRVAVELVEHVAAALHAAWEQPLHGQGKPLRLLHGDLAPSMLRLSEQGQLKVCGFGLSAPDGPDPRFAAPEVRSGQLGPAADIYSLGLHMARWMSGRDFPPAPADASAHSAFLSSLLDDVWRKIIVGQPASVQQAMEPLSLMLETMLEFQPSRRPSARRVQLGCRSMLGVLPGPWLQSWAQVRVPELLARAEEPARGPASVVLPSPVVPAPTAEPAPPPPVAERPLEPQKPPAQAQPVPEPIAAEIGEEELEENLPQDLSAEEEPPAAEEDEPSTDAEQPSAEEEQPSAEVEEPAAEEEQPSVEEEQPAVEQAEPSADAEQPSADAEQPSVEEEQPAVEQAEPSADAEQPSADAEQPSADAEQPSAEEEQPSVEEEQPSADAELDTDEDLEDVSQDLQYVGDADLQELGIEDLDARPAVEPTSEPADSGQDGSYAPARVAVPSADERGTDPGIAPAAPEPVEQEPVVAPVPAAGTAPKPAAKPAAAARPTGRRATWWVVGFFGLMIALVVLLWMLGLIGPPGEPSTSPALEPQAPAAAPAAPSQPAAPRPVAEESPPEPAPAEAAPEPEVPAVEPPPVPGPERPRAPAAQPSPAPRERTVTPAPAPAPPVEPAAAPEPTAEPEPTAQPAREPEPEPAPPPAPAASSAGQGTVRQEGDASRIQLQSDSGSFPLGAVPAGTYTVSAWFGDGDAVPAGTITIAAGETVTLRCSSLMLRCSRD